MQEVYLITKAKASQGGNRRIPIKDLISYLYIVLKNVGNHIENVFSYLEIQTHCPLLILLIH